MPRAERTYQRNCYFHVVTRGVNRQLIFEEDSDFEKFKQVLFKNLQKFNTKLVAYCLMMNHIHLLFDIDSQNISDIMRCVLSQYALYFNKKYDRTGSLFENRFKCKTINDTKYLFQAIRYILQNPLKASVASVDKYKWSSFNEYLASNPYINSSVINSSFFEISDFINFLNCSEENYSFDFAETINNNDKEKIDYIKEKYNLNDVSEIQNISKNERNVIISHLRSCGLSIKQINRLTGISRGVIQNIY